MLTTRWGPPTYADVADPGGGEGGGGTGQDQDGWNRIPHGGRRGRGFGNGRGGQGYGAVPRNPNVQQVGNQQNVRADALNQVNQQAQLAMRESQELKDRALKKKAYLQLKWDLESNRKFLGKGNLVNITINGLDRGVSITKQDVCKMLRAAQLSTDDVAGITFNDYRSNVVEVMLGEGVLVDTMDMESKINLEGGFDVSVSKFDKSEEFLTIYGLPLSKDENYVRTQIEEAIGPFVKEVTEVKSLAYSYDDGNEFFSGKKNGSWRVKVVPKMGSQIPNYIVVGNREKVMGKAVYSRNAGEKAQMCADCFSTEHFKMDTACPGPVKWSVYCQQFREAWNNQSMVQEVQDEEGLPVVVESRAGALERTLEAKLVELEDKKKELGRKIAEQEKVNDDIKRLEDGLEEEKRKNEVMKEELENMRREKEELQIKAVEDQSLLEKAFSRMSENVTVRSNSVRPTENEAFDPDTSDISLGGESDIFMSVNNDIIQGGLTDESSSSFHGFMPDGIIENGSQLGEHIADLENSIEKEVEIDDSIGPKVTDPPNTPKRKKPEEPLEQRVVKPRNDRKGSVEHPVIGKSIIMETSTGEAIYKVYSKKNNRVEDYIYVLSNIEGTETTFDLRKKTWKYHQEKDPLGGEN